MDWISKKAALTFNPDRVRGALTSLETAWPKDLRALRDLIEQFPTGEKGLLALLEISPASVEKIAHDPAALAWLSQPEICASERGPRRMRAHLDREKAPAFDPRFRALRRVKNRELLRIALRDV